MPEPGSHAYDTQRARLRAQLDDTGTPDKHATEKANEILQGGPELVDVQPGEEFTVPEPPKKG